MPRYCFTFLVLCGMILIGCASTAPLPPTLNIVPPSPDVPPKLAAFSGIWEGKVDGAIDTILVVEKINTESAEIIFSLGDWLGVKSRYFYATAKVLPGYSIEWINPVGNRFVYKIDKDLKSISGFLEEKSTGAKFLIYMTRSKSQ